jgi:hypothetical protein
MLASRSVIESEKFELESRSSSFLTVSSEGKDATAASVVGWRTALLSRTLAFNFDILRCKRA